MTTTDNPVIAFDEGASDCIEKIAESLHAKYLPPQGMSRASKLIPFLPFSKTTLFEWSKDGRFPAPVKLSPTITAWRNSEVIAWLEAQSANAEGA